MMKFKHNKRIFKMIRKMTVSIIVITSVILNCSEKTILHAIELYNNRPFDRTHDLSEKYDSSKHP